MKEDLNEFFSLIGKAKKEKEDEFRSLVGEINIDSIFSSIKTSLEEDKKKKEKQLKEEKKKKEKQAKQVKALEAWLYSESKEKDHQKEKHNLNETIENDNSDLTKKSNYQIIESINPQPIGALVEIKEVIGDAEEKDDIEDDAIDHALKILETITTKQEVRENKTDPEIVKIRRELEYLKNIVNAQGGGGEVRLEFLDDVDRNTAKTNNYYLKYDSSLDKWIGDPGSGGGGSQNLNTTLGFGNTSSLGMSVGILTATSFLGNGSQLTGIVTNITAGSGISINQSTGNVIITSTGTGGGLVGLTIQDEGTIVGIANSITTLNFVGDNISAIASGTISTITVSTQNYVNVAGVSTYSSVSGIATVSQGLTGTPNISVGNIIATTASFSGDVSIAGTITYEDVTNVDSIGFITSRSGINVGQPSGIGVTISNNGSAIFSGIVTASSFIGDGSQLTGVIATYSSTAGVSTYSSTAGIATSVSGGTADVTSVILPDGIVSSGSQTTTTILETSIDSFSVSLYRSAKYQVQITRGSEYQITEIFIVHDGSSSYGTEYATIKTGSTLSSFSTDIDSGSVRLLATPTSSSSTTFRLIRTLVEV